MQSLPIRAAAASRPASTPPSRTTDGSSGGVAFRAPQFTPPSGYSNLSESGWYALYPNRSAVPAKPPAWLDDYGGSIALLEGGAAYLALRRDPADCSRTALL